MRFFTFTCLFLALASVSLADGMYQRTKDGKVYIWNNRPLPGDQATWSGGRDEQGYATGHGTLTWFRTEQKILTGSNIPMSKHVAESRYTGNMVKGKFKGLVVNIDANGRTFHGTYVDGRKTKDWTAGAPAASGASGSRAAANAPAGSIELASVKPNESVQTSLAAEPVEDQRPGPAVSPASIEPDPPAAGPLQSPASVKVQQPMPNEKQAAPDAAPNDYDDSLRSLVGPPSGLRVNAKATATPQLSAPPKIISNPVAAPSAAPSSKLTAAQVDEIADAEARSHGYNLADFQHPQAKYDSASDRWTVTYERKSFDGYGMAAVGQSFTIHVEDKTKKTSLAPEK